MTRNNIQLEKVTMKLFWTCLYIVIIFSILGAGHSFASRPVPKTVIGCVTNGSLHSSDGYEIRVRNLDLGPYEGKRIQMRGNLLPGDNFHANTESIKVLGNCGKRRR